MDLLKILKSFLGGEDGEDEEFKLSETDIAKAKEMPESALKAITGALNILTKYKDVFPADVLTAIKTLTKYAAYAYPEKKSAELEGEEYVKDIIEKAGAKLSKATIEQLQKIRGILDSLIGDKEDKVKKGLGEDFDKLPDTVKKRLARATELEAAEEERIRKEKSDKDQELQTTIQKMKDEIAELKKTRGKKKGLKQGGGGEDEEDETDDDEGDETDYQKKVKKNKGQSLWPSFVAPENDEE